MKTTTLYILLSLFLFNSLLAQDSLIPKSVDGQLLVQLKSKHSIDLLKKDFSFIGITGVQVVSERFNVYLLEYNVNKSSSNRLMKLIEQQKQVVHVQRNHLVTERGWEETCLPDDTYFNNQWSLLNTGQAGGLPGADIEATSAWDLTTGGQTVFGDTIVVAILDGGSDINHEDIDFWKNRGEIPNNQIDDDLNGYVDDYDGWNAYNHTGNIPLYNHGIHVSGIAAARGNNAMGVTGVNWGTKVMPIAGSSSTSEATVVEALSYIYTQRERYNLTGGVEGAFVVAENCSFGVDGGNPDNFPIWEAMYDSLGQIGVLSIGATANKDWNIDVVGDVPTAFTTPYLISVTNTTKTDVKYGNAGYGRTTIDLGAPGTIIMSCRVNNSYGTSTGTSMAAPQVTGAVALLFAAADTAFINDYRVDPGAGALAVKEAILNGVDYLPVLDTLTVTGGRLNVFKAIQELYKGPIVHLDLCAVTDTIEPNSTKTANIVVTNTGLSVYEFDLHIPDQPNWIAAETSLNKIQPQGEGVIQLTFNSTGLTTGAYPCNLHLQSTALPDIIIPVVLVVDTSVGLMELTENQVVQFFPNPFTEKLFVQVQQPSGIKHLKLDLFNQWGKYLFSQDLMVGGKETIKIETGTMSSGIYFYRLTSETVGIIQGKLIKL